MTRSWRIFINYFIEEHKDVPVNRSQIQSGIGWSNCQGCCAFDNEGCTFCRIDAQAWLSQKGWTKSYGQNLRFWSNLVRRLHHNPLSARSSRRWCWVRSLRFIRSLTPLWFLSFFFPFFFIISKLRQFAHSHFPSPSDCFWSIGFFYIHFFFYL